MLAVDEGGLLNLRIDQALSQSTHRTRGWESDQAMRRISELMGMCLDEAFGLEPWVEKNMIPLNPMSCGIHEFRLEGSHHNQRRGTMGREPREFVLQELTMRPCPPA